MGGGWVGGIDRSILFYPALYPERLTSLGKIRRLPGSLGSVGVAPKGGGTSENQRVEGEDNQVLISPAFSLQGSIRLAEFINQRFQFL